MGRWPAAMTRSLTAPCGLCSVLWKEMGPSSTAAMGLKLTSLEDQQEQGSSQALWHAVSQTCKRSVWYVR